MKMTLRISPALLISIPVAVLVAQDQPWQHKSAAQWTEQEAQAILSDSPWAKPTVPIVERTANGRQRGMGGMGGGPGVRIGGIGVGGMGGPKMGGRNGGMGRPPAQTDPGVDGAEGS